MNYVILDLEATCWEERGKNRNEIIEIGAVLVNEHQEIESEFAQFVKPVRNPVLSDFCTELTSITQRDVDAAASFREVLEDFQRWFGLSTDDYILCSWGFYDRNQFREDCALHGLDDSWVRKHISLKHQHGKITGQRRNLGMKRALAYEGLPLEGTHHRGIDDARNIARIFLNHFSDWDFNAWRRH